MSNPRLRLLLFNLVTDINDPVLGFTTAWIEALVPHCDYIDVITMYEGEHHLPDTVRVFSAGRERGLSKPLRVIKFYQHLLARLATRPYDVCFAHMMPLFAGLGGALLTARGIRTVLWYTHRQQSRQLKWGMQASWRVVTAVPTSFPYPTDKLRVIGHGIDTDFYTPSAEVSRADMPHVIQVARLASIKHQDTTLKAVADIPAHLTLVGDVQQGSPPAYKQALQSLADQLAITERVTFAGDLPPVAVRDAYQRADVAVNMSPVGLFDKAALESMACGVPTIVANPAFADLMGDYADKLIVAHPDDVDGLQRRLHDLLALSSEERHAIGQQLRLAVIARYSLPILIERLLAVLRTGDV